MAKTNVSEKYKTTTNSTVLSTEGFVLTKQGPSNGSGCRAQTHEGQKWYETI